MRTRLIFVRHGESVHTVRRMTGVACQGLTEAGTRQAADVAQRLTAHDVAAVYSSTLRRAIDTGTPIAQALGVALRQDCGLCTWHMPSAAAGLSVEQFTTDHAVAGGGIFRPWQQGNETWAELVVRASRAIVEIADRHRGATTVLVGHSETVSTSFHALGQLPLMRSFDLVVSPASITEWVTDDDPTQWPPARWTLVRFNDVQPTAAVPGRDTDHEATGESW